MAEAKVSDSNGGKSTEREIPSKKANGGNREERGERKRQEKKNPADVRVDKKPEGRGGKVISSPLPSGKDSELSEFDETVTSSPPSPLPEPKAKVIDFPSPLSVSPFFSLSPLPCQSKVRCAYHSFRSYRYQKTPMREETVEERGEEREERRERESTEVLAFSSSPLSELDSPLSPPSELDSPLSPKTATKALPDDIDSSRVSGKTSPKHKGSLLSSLLSPIPSSPPFPLCNHNLLLPLYAPQLSPPTHTHTGVVSKPLNLSPLLSLYAERREAFEMAFLAESFAPSDEERGEGGERVLGTSGIVMALGRAAPDLSAKEVSFFSLLSFLSPIPFLLSPLLCLISLLSSSCASVFISPLSPLPSPLFSSLGETEGKLSDRDCIARGRGGECEVQRGVSPPSLLLLLLLLLPLSHRVICQPSFTSQLLKKLDDLSDARERKVEEEAKGREEGRGGGGGFFGCCGGGGKLPHDPVTDPLPAPLSSPPGYGERSEKEMKVTITPSFSLLPLSFLFPSHPSSLLSSLSSPLSSPS